MENNSNRTKRYYAAYVDGGCFNNGKLGAEAYGSYQVYDFGGKYLSSNKIHALTKEQSIKPMASAMRFALLQEHTISQKSQYQDSTKSGAVDLLSGDYDYDYEITTQEELNAEISRSTSTCLGGVRPTNNVAEALAMYMLFMYLQHHAMIKPENDIRIFSDSQLIINQLQAVYATKDKNLAKVYRMCYRTLKKAEAQHKAHIFDMIYLEQIPGTLMKRVLGH